MNAQGTNKMRKNIVKLFDEGRFQLEIATKLKKGLLDPQLWLEGSYVLGLYVRPSVLLSFRLSVQRFSWGWLISFF